MSVKLVSKAIRIVFVCTINAIKRFESMFSMIPILACECNSEGSKSNACSDSGQCECKDNVEGLPCDHCKDEHFGFPTCEGNLKN